MASMPGSFAAGGSSGFALSLGHWCIAVPFRRSLGINQSKGKRPPCFLGCAIKPPSATQWFLNSSNDLGSVSVGGTVPHTSQLRGELFVNPACRTPCKPPKLALRILFTVIFVKVQHFETCSN